MRSLILVVFSLIALVGCDQEAGQTADNNELLPQCVKTTNLGTINPKWKNDCGTKTTHEAVFRDINGNLIRRSVWHLREGEERPFAFRGYAVSDPVYIRNDWTPEAYVEPGDRYISLSRRAVGSTTLWSAYNSNPRRMIAAVFTIRSSAGTFEVSDIVPAGGSIRVYPFDAPETGRVVVRHAWLEPE